MNRLLFRHRRIASDRRWTSSLRTQGSCRPAVRSRRPARTRTGRGVGACRLCTADPTPTLRWRAMLALEARREQLIARLEARGTHATWVLWAALAGMFATTFPITILSVSLAPIAHEFGARETTMAWVISAPMLLSAIALPLLGKLGDLRGHRRVFLFGFAAATLTAVATVFAWSAPSLIALRTLAAVVGSATQPSSMALIFGVTSREQRVRAM